MYQGNPYLTYHTFKYKKYMYIHASKSQHRYLVTEESGRYKTISRYIYTSQFEIKTYLKFTVNKHIHSRISEKVTKKIEYKQL